jgi:hypothetical protein
MKIAKLTYGLMVATMFSLASCDINDYPEFSDSDAFVAIQTSTASIVENNTETTLEIPVMLTSLSGIKGSVDFTITTDTVAAAVEGENYQLVNASKTLTFTKEEPTQYIKIKTIDNNTFGGDVKFTITLSNPQGAQLGANKTCLVTIEDDEHPLAFILGTFTAHSESGFGGDLDWEVVLEKDVDDLSKVWIDNFVPGGTGMKVYGTVNEDKTELHIPVGQDILSNSSYDCKVRAFYGYDGADEIPEGGYITGQIAEDGTITILDDYGTYAYNKGTTTGAGWYEYVMGNAVWTKK